MPPPVFDPYTVARAAIVAWFAPPLVEHLNHVYPARPRNLDAAKFLEGHPGDTFGAVGVVHLAGDSDMRLAGAAGHGKGHKYFTFTAQFGLYLRSTQPKAEDAQAEFDTLKGHWLSRFWQDPSLGGAVFSAGETLRTGEWPELGTIVSPHADTVAGGPAAVHHVWGIFTFDLSLDLLT